MPREAPVTRAVFPESVFMIFSFCAGVRLLTVDPGCALRPTRATRPAKATFALGFLTGQEMDWLPEAMRILRDELPNMEVTVSSQYSPQLADALRRGKLDVAFMRPEAQTPDLAYRLVTKEQLVAVLPSDHRLAACDAIDPHDIVGETFVSVSNTAPALRVVIDDYLE